MTETVYSADAKASFVRTSSRRSVYPFDPKPDQFHIEDIAHALSMQCRFNGHLDEFYSVAQHSVYVSRYCDNNVSRLWGLLHDAPEAYISDIPTPVKRYLPREIDLVEEGIARAICERFQVLRTPDIDRDVRNADYQLLVLEAITLHPDRFNILKMWGLKDVPPRGTRLDTAFPGFEPLPPKKARDLFLEEFDTLTASPSLFLAEALA